MKKIAIVGGGPAGYVAAIRAAQLGGQVTLIEAAQLGGTCLNVGCVPTKALIHTARLLQGVSRFSQEGIILGGTPGVDMARVMARKAAVVRRLVTGVTHLMAQNKVRVVKGEGRLTADRRVMVTLSDGGQEQVEADALILCTGSEPGFPRGLSPDGQWVITSTEALSLQAIPKNLVIIGGGVIGVEFAYIYRQFGSNVTIVELEQGLLPQEDPEAGEALARSLAKAGVTLLLAAKVIGLQQADRQVVVADARGEEIRLPADQVLVATGRRPRLAGLGAEAAGLALERGFVKVNDCLETSLTGLYAAGDVTGLPQLAHAAFEQGQIAAENAVLGTRKQVDMSTVPRCVYGAPEVAAVGLSEPAARAQFGDVLVGHFPLMANGKALADGAGDGFVKVIARRQYGQVLGVVMVGEHVSEIIGQAVLGMQLEATLDEFGGVIAPHPTVSETLKEAALSALGRGVHA